MSADDRRTDDPQGGDPRYYDESESIGDRIQDPTTKTYITFSVGVFLAVGLGYGLTLFLVSELAETGMTGDIAGAGSLVIGVLLAPLIAGITGLTTGFRMDGDDAKLAGGVGAAVGVVVMLVVLLVFASLISSGGGGGGGDLDLGPLIGLVLGVGATGAMAAAVPSRTDVI